ncbi:GMC family oxidoreductase [Nevskia sp.]|uniref:GMC oxidoreductase n=1 Tax=Nevskia sp. TaxID=1929292 RepID=UPI0025FADB3B|nr:GMC family oxidoreductase [Nevskia sp.]
MIDDASSLAPDAALRADICIVGAGAAGITLALELRDSGKSVLLLESGGLKDEAASQALYAGETSDEALHPPPDKYRVRRFGGSTTIWGGRCMPFDAIDFEARPYLPHSGWPIGLDDIAPFYPRANELVEAGRYAYTAETAYDGPAPPAIRGFDSEQVSQNRLERFSLPTNFAARHGHLLEAAANVRVLLHANCTAIRLAPDGAAVARLDCATLDGKRFTVEAGEYVLATGGLEVPRLLLASNDVAKAGIGNGHDLVGRYYMCHIAGTAGTLTVTKPRADVHHGYVTTPDGVYARRRFAINEAVQRKLGTGNFVARLHFANLNDPAHKSGILSGLYLAKSFISYEYSKRLHDGRQRTVKTWLQHARNIVFDPFDTLAFLWHWITKRTLATRKFPSVVIPSRANRFSLDFHSEQAPNPDSRVTLTDQRDALGVPQIRIDWRYTDWDIDTVRVSLGVIRDELARTGCGRLEYDEASVAQEALRYGAYGGHHIGTARMGATPQTGVVDADLRVFGMSNLSIASAAVFPTSSQANPTLTIVAFAVRLAQRLRGST